MSDIGRNWPAIPTPRTPEVEEAVRSWRPTDGAWQHQTLSTVLATASFKRTCCERTLAKLATTSEGVEGPAPTPILFCPRLGAATFFFLRLFGHLKEF